MRTSPDRTQSAGYAPAVDGLRALAVGAVVAFHAGLPWARGGFLGVSLFFTISGFLITRLLVAEHAATGRVRLRAFWERRYRRLMPAAVITIIGVVLAAPYFSDAAQLATLRGDALAAVAYVANWHSLAQGHDYADLFRAPSPLLHFWSLAIEEQFYLLFPLVAAFALRRRGLRALTCAVCAMFVASVAWQVWLGDVDRVYLGTDTRAAELLAGALLALALTSPRAREHITALPWSIMSLAGLGIFTALAATTSARATWLGHGGLAAVAIVNVTLVAGAVTGAGALRFLALRPLVAIGRVSYGIYLFHWPVFLWLTSERTGLHGVALATARLAVVAALTVASYHLVECPIRYARVLRGLRTLAPAGAVALSAVLVATVMVTTSRPQPLTDARVFTERAAVPARRVAPLRVLVVGDETAHAYASTLGTPVSGNLVVRDAARPRCPLIATNYARRFATDAPVSTEPCRDALVRWVAEIRSFHPDVTIVSSQQETFELASSPSGPFVDLGVMAVYVQMIDSYSNIARLLRAAGTTVLWTLLGHTDARTPAGPQTGLSPGQRIGLVNEAIRLAAQHELGVVSLRAPSGPGTEATLRHAYRNARLELGLDRDRDRTRRNPADPVRVLVAGDSTSLNIAAALADHGVASGDVVVDWSGAIGCPLLPVPVVREVGDDHPTPVQGCVPFREGLLRHIADFQPDVVIVVASFMDASDMQRTVGARWEHLGQPAFDDSLSSEYEAAVTLVRNFGARVAWATAPFEDARTDGSTTVLRARLARLNQMITGLRARHPDLAIVPFGASVDRADGTVDRRARPDGVHFTIPAARAMVDEWLARDLIAIARR